MLISESNKNSYLKLIAKSIVEWKIVHNEELYGQILEQLLLNHNLCKKYSISVDNENFSFADKDSILIFLSDTLSDGSDNPYVDRIYIDTKKLKKEDVVNNYEKEEIPGLIRALIFIIDKILNLIVDNFKRILFKIKKPVPDERIVLNLYDFSLSKKPAQQILSTYWLKSNKKIRINMLNFFINCLKKDIDLVYKENIMAILLLLTIKFTKNEGKIKCYELLPKILDPRFYEFSIKNRRHEIFLKLAILAILIIVILIIEAFMKIFQIDFSILSFLSNIFDMLYYEIQSWFTYNEPVSSITVSPHKTDKNYAIDNDISATIQYYLLLLFAGILFIVGGVVSAVTITAISAIFITKVTGDLLLKKIDTNSDMELNIDQIMQKVIEKHNELIEIILEFSDDPILISNILSITKKIKYNSYHKISILLKNNQVSKKIKEIIFYWMFKVDICKT